MKRECTLEPDQSFGFCRYFHLLDLIIQTTTTLFHPSFIFITKTNEISTKIDFNLKIEIRFNRIIQLIN